MTLKAVSFARPIQHEPRLSVPWTPGIKSTRYWTKAEDAILRKHWEKDGPPKCLALLKGRSYMATQQHALKLGLSRKGMKAIWLPNAPADIDHQIRTAWEKMNGKQRGEVNELADKLKVPRWWLSKRLLKLGLAHCKTKEKAWTAAELALMPKLPLHDPERSSKIMRQHGFRRTPTAIMVKAKRLDLSRRYTETLSATKLAKIIGIDSKGITARVISGEIKGTKRKTRRLAQQGGDPWSITRADAREWAIRCLEQIDFRKVDKFAFVDLLVNQGKS